MTPKGINTGLLGETIGETKVHLVGALRNGHSNINVSFLNTPPLRHVPMVKIIRSVQRSEVPDEGPPGAAAQASRSMKKAGMTSCSDVWSQVRFGSFGFFWFRASLWWPPGWETPS